MTSSHAISDKWRPGAFYHVTGARNSSCGAANRGPPRSFGSRSLHSDDGHGVQAHQMITPVTQRQDPRQGTRTMRNMAIAPLCLNGSLG